MVAVRKRALSSIQNAFPGTKLQTRYTAALFMLKKVCSGRLIWAFTELGKLHFRGCEGGRYILYTVVTSFYQSYDTFGSVQNAGYCFQFILF
jgi:hypothetical protein